MILLEVVEAERRKVVAALSPATEDGPSRRHPEVVHPPETSNSQLPDYATSQAQAETQKEGDIKKTARWSDKRLGRAIVYALVIYLVLSISIAVPLFILLRNKDRANDIANSENWVKNGGGNLPPPPPPPDRLPPDVSNLPSVYGTPMECNNWTYVSASSSHGPYYTLQYSLPLTDTIYIRSNFSEMDDDNIRSPVTGSLHVSVLNDTAQSNATASVIMKDTGDEALREASVCLMGSNTTWGLAIYVPDDANEDNYYFDVDLKLPLPQATALFSNLATYLPSFNQTFEQLDSYTNLDSFVVQGSLGSINIESVHARSILVKASAAGISGTFNASEKVILETVLAPITANVSLYNGGNYQRPSQLNIETGNSDIVLNVTLYSDSNASAYCPPMFMSSLKTFSGAIEAAYHHDYTSVSSTLFVRATNSIEPARVFVDGAFEGTYDVHTTLADATVDRVTDLVDPSGAGRTRVFEDDLVSTNRALGWVGWGSRPTNLGGQFRQGHIEVVSSLSTAVLQLTDVPDINRLASSKVSKAVISQT